MWRGVLQLCDHQETVSSVSTQISAIQMVDLDKCQFHENISAQFSNFNVHIYYLVTLLKLLSSIQQLLLCLNLDILNEDPGDVTVLFLRSLSVISKLRKNLQEIRLHDTCHTSLSKTVYITTIMNSALHYLLTQ